MLNRSNPRHRLATALFAAVAATAAFAPGAAQAGNPCQSEWIKFKTFFDQNGALVARGICQLANSKDAAAAQRCVETYENWKKKIDNTIGKYNATTGDSAGKIGPRGLPEATWATGTLLVERTFAGVPILSDSYRVEFQRTGGKAEKPLHATICFLDSEGNMAMPEAKFTVDAKNTSFDRLFTGVAGLTPVILLEKPPGLNGHQYQIRGTRGAEPAVVVQARGVK